MVARNRFAKAVAAARRLAVAIVFLGVAASWVHALGPRWSPDQDSPDWDRAGALRDCRMALSASYPVITTFDVVAEAHVDSPWMAVVAGGALMEEADGSTTPFRYRCEYDVGSHRVADIMAAPARVAKW